MGKSQKMTSWNGFILHLAPDVGAMEIFYDYSTQFKCGRWAGSTQSAACWDGCQKAAINAHPNWWFENQNPDRTERNLCPHSYGWIHLPIPRGATCAKGRVIADIRALAKPASWYRCRSWNMGSPEVGCLLCSLVGCQVCSVLRYGDWWFDAWSCHNYESPRVS